MKKIINTLLLLTICTYSILSPFRKTYASNEDFVVDTNTQITYTTGDNYVNVKTEYIRTVKNSSYYFPATGEKIFHIPDISDSKEEDVLKEREYKLGTLLVQDEKGNSVKHSIEQKESGEGIYITVPNFRTTTSSSTYKVILSYNTHDYIQRLGKYVSIVGTSLSRETVFSKEDEKNGTNTTFNYNFSIVVDENIYPLAKAYPAYTKEQKDGKTIYKFKQTDRIGASPYLEFGTEVVYRFELEYKTNKTDNLIPEKYSDFLGALSTNIYEISLPREFAETSQKVYFENVNPKPKDIYRDNEGNILALFEVPANQESTINISGYIVVQQDELSESREDFNIGYEEYLSKMKGSEYIRKYLGSTKYWEVKDEFIRQEADILKKDLPTLLDIIKANYKYVNDKLEYDDIKATSENERIGAKAALLGGPAVCMEYADVMISLLRAQGIPSRAAIGYANLKEESTKDQVRHQWVQVWVPDYGWLSVDPTFESLNMKIGQMVDRVLWDVFNGDTLSNIRIYSANDIKSLTSEGYTVSIYGVDSSSVDLDNLSSYSDLISKDDISESSRLATYGNTILKTTSLGKALIVTVPILLILGILILVIGITQRIIKKRKKST